MLVLFELRRGGRGDEWDDIPLRRPVARVPEAGYDGGHDEPVAPVAAGEVGRGRVVLPIGGRGVLGGVAAILGVWLLLWLLGSVLGLRGRVGGRRVGWGWGLADAGEGGVDFVLGEVLGAEEGEFLFVGGGGYGGVLEDWSGEG